MRNFAVRALSRQGYEVLEAGTGVEALEVMEREKHRVDIVVSDVIMPEMDGPTLLKELRKTNPALKFIFVSGYPDDAFKKSLDDNEAIRLPAQALHAAAACRQGEGAAGAVILSRYGPALPSSWPQRSHSSAMGAPVGAAPLHRVAASAGMTLWCRAAFAVSWTKEHPRRKR